MSLDIKPAWVGGFSGGDGLISRTKVKKSSRSCTDATFRGISGLCLLHIFPYLLNAHASSSLYLGMSVTKRKSVLCLLLNRSEFGCKSAIKCLSVHQSSICLRELTPMWLKYENHVHNTFTCDPRISFSSCQHQMSSAEEPEQWLIYKEKQSAEKHQNPAQMQSLEGNLAHVVPHFSIFPQCTCIQQIYIS